MTKVFVSYAREDGGVVYPLVMRLKRHGVPIWIDEHNIESGMHWDLAIEDALRDASHVLVILSKASVQSQYVRAEIDLALEGKKKIVPILINACTRPIQIRRIQYIDFMKDEVNGFKKLLKALPHELNLNQESVSRTIVVPKAGAVDGVYGEKFVIFPEDKKTIQEGGKYIYPTLVFESTNRKNRRNWIMKINALYIGREHDCDIVIPSKEISRRHAQIVRRGERYQIIDLDSTNGTWMNGEKLEINKPIVLKHGDKLNFAHILHIEFQFITPNHFINEETTQLDRID